MEPLAENNNQVPYHHKIEPSEITTSDDDSDDGQTTSRNKRKKQAAPKKQPTRKPIQLKTYAHQFFLQQKELCGFRGKTNEAFVMYLLQTEEKRRKYDKTQPETQEPEEDHSHNKRMAKRRDEIIELDRVVKELKYVSALTADIDTEIREENDVLKRTAEGWKHQCELLDNRLKLTERCLSTAEMNTNSILKQKEKLEEELYRYRSHLQAMMTRGNEYITYGEPAHKIAKGYEQPHAYSLPPPKPEALKHSLSTTMEYPNTGQVEYIRNVGDSYEMRDYAALPQYPPLNATIYSHPGYHQDVVNIGPSPPSDFMTILNMDYKQRNVRQMKHDYHPNQNN